MFIYWSMFILVSHIKCVPLDGSMKFFLHTKLDTVAHFAVNNALGFVNHSLTFFKNKIYSVFFVPTYLRFSVHFFAHHSAGRSLK